jgi:hypothetical protein
MAVFPTLSVLDTSDGMRVWHVRELCSAVEDAASKHVGRSARQLLCIPRELKYVHPADEAGAGAHLQHLQHNNSHHATLSQSMSPETTLKMLFINFIQSSSAHVSFVSTAVATSS